MVPERLVVVDCRIQPRFRETEPQTDQGGDRHAAVAARHPLLGEFTFPCEENVPLLFTENETNHERLFPSTKNESPFVKDGINDCVVQGKSGAVNPDKQGTKVAAHYRQPSVPAKSVTVRLRLAAQSAEGGKGSHPSERVLTKRSPRGGRKRTSSTMS